MYVYVHVMFYYVAVYMDYAVSNVLEGMGVSQLLDLYSRQCEDRLVVHLICNSSRDP